MYIRKFSFKNAQIYSATLFGEFSELLILLLYYAETNGNPLKSRLDNHWFYNGIIHQYLEVYTWYLITFTLIITSFIYRTGFHLVYKLVFDKKKLKCDCLIHNFIHFTSNNFTDIYFLQWSDDFHFFIFKWAWAFVASCHEAFTKKFACSPYITIFFSKSGTVAPLENTFSLQRAEYGLQKPRTGPYRLLWCHFWRRWYNGMMMMITTN